MNRFLIIGFIITILPLNAMAAVCQTYSACSKMCTKTAQSWCCGEERTIYDCPDGWSSLGSMCRRSNADAGEDSRGYMATTYGTCDATSSIQTCYRCSQTGCK